MQTGVGSVSSSHHTHGASSSLMSGLPPPPPRAEAVHHVSVSINASHSSLVCGEAWGTEPSFSWLHERVAVSSAVGTVSKDGTTLYVTKTPFCGSFTCTVSNKMGHSTATYTAGERLRGGALKGAACTRFLLLLGGKRVF